MRYIEFNEVAKAIFVKGLGMSRKTAALVIFIYFVLVLAIAAFLQFQALSSPFDPEDELFYWRTIGAAASLFILSGIIPVIVWAFRRFRAQKASLPLILWAALLAILAALTALPNGS